MPRGDEVKAILRESLGKGSLEFGPGLLHGEEGHIRKQIPQNSGKISGLLGQSCNNIVYVCFFFWFFPDLNLAGTPSECRSCRFPGCRSKFEVIAAA